MPLLAVDIGNSHTVLGLVQDGEVSADWRVSTDTRRSADEWAVLLRGLIGGVGQAEAPVGGAGRDLHGILS